ncbi:hypothetical protein H257_17520 [Aphanomyces astaci]|uniref:Uncharacterized protein n=1 Tax=Aphanomyces astaci TaxID=112090 RepID=W4FEH4_APHAT|nr:hypothetical protein H257_17520 [Aphanomyces astaci]ETV65880.1 hypothetical protein H257_17520 [Aphanomyces astaci]|eukprot:XP_009844633.1 hypothetical protein H257_17520 [Aphanomyces astaci]
MQDWPDTVVRTSKGCRHGTTTIKGCYPMATTDGTAVKVTHCSENEEFNTRTSQVRHGMQGKRQRLHGISDARQGRYCSKGGQGMLRHGNKTG